MEVYSAILFFNFISELLFVLYCLSVQLHVHNRYNQENFEGKIAEKT